MGGFLDGSGDGGGLIPALAGPLSLLSPSAAGLWSAQGSVALSMAAVASRVFGSTPRSSGPGSPDAPPSQPSPAPDQPAPTQAPGGATAGGGSVGGGFSGALFAGLFALMGLAALRIGPLVMASARLRPQAYIALLERPG